MGPSFALFILAFAALSISAVMDAINERGGRRVASIITALVFAGIAIAAATY